MMRGVSAAKEDVHAAIKNIDKGIFPQAFCKIIPDILGGDPEYCNIMHADGAGTKSSLAYMYWKETGDLSVWKGIAQDAIVMNTDDLLCVGAVDNILVSSTIGRNKMLVPGEVISAIINGTDELLAELREMGIGIYPTGGETADVGDLVRTIIVDSTVTCRMKRSDVIDNANIRPGDVIVGLSSTGQATYEKRYNGGMGSNGLTSARHDVFAKYLAENYPESYDHAVPDELVYQPVVTDSLCQFQTLLKVAVLHRMINGILVMCPYTCIVISEQLKTDTDLIGLYLISLAHCLMGFAECTRQIFHMMAYFVSNHVSIGKGITLDTQLALHLSEERQVDI